MRRGGDTRAMLAAAVASPDKLYLAAHGNLMKGSFQLPEGVVLVFLTYPGACLYQGVVMKLLHTEESARNVILRKKKGFQYSVTYLPGSQVQDHTLSLYERGRMPWSRSTQGFGLFRVPWVSNFYDREANVPRPGRKRFGFFPRSGNTKLSAFVRDLVASRASVGSFDHPLVLFVGACRATDNSSVFAACRSKDDAACRRVGGRFPAHVKSFATAEKAVAGVRNREFVEEWGLGMEDPEEFLEEPAHTIAGYVRRVVRKMKYR